MRAQDAHRLTAKRPSIDPAGEPFDINIDLLPGLAAREVNSEESAYYDYAEVNETLTGKRRLPRLSGRIPSVSIQLPALPGCEIFAALSSLLPVRSPTQEQTFLILPLLHADRLIGLLTFGWH